MNPRGKFIPPKTKEEFEEMSSEISTEAAVAVLSALEARRADMVAEIDQEIAFYREVLDARGEA